jgi:hypothetical protein
MSKSPIEVISARLDHLERENRHLREVARRWMWAGIGLVFLIALGIFGLRGATKARAQAGAPFVGDSWKPLKIGGFYLNRFLITHARIAEAEPGHRTLEVSFAGTEPPLRLTSSESEAMIWWLDGIALELKGPPKEAPVPKGKGP